MHFLAELLTPQPRLEQRAAGGAVHVLAHQVEDGPGGKAFQRQHGLRAGLLANAPDDFQIFLSPTSSIR